MSVRFVDCTLRDGGNLNAWQFTADHVRRIVQGLSDAGVDIIEVGYLGGSGSNPATHTGIAARCPAEFIDGLPFVHAVVAIMVVPSVCPLSELNALANSRVRLVRVASYPQDLELSLRTVERLKAIGVETVSTNVMAASHLSADDLSKMAQSAKRAGADIFYFADSFGSMHPDSVREAVQAIRFHDIGVGFHGHNNLGLAFTNALTAYREGAEYIDGSLCGMARGAGNLPTEQWIAAAAVWHWLPQHYKVDAVLSLSDFVREQVLTGPVPATSIEIRMGIHNLHYYYWDLVLNRTEGTGWDPCEALRHIALRRPIAIDRTLVDDVLAAVARQ